MSYARTALRLAAELALSDGRTLAGHLVFDSRLDAIDLLSETEARPIVTIFTEDQVDEACEQASGGGVTLKERMPFLDLYLQTRASREFLRDPVKNLDRVGRIIMAPGSKAIA